MYTSRRRTMICTWSKIVHRCFPVNSRVDSDLVISGDCSRAMRLVDYFEMDVAADI